MVTMLISIARRWVDVCTGRVSQHGDQAADDDHPVAGVEHQQGHGGGHVQRDDEHRVRRVLLGAFGDQMLPIQAGTNTECP